MTVVLIAEIISGLGEVRANFQLGVEASHKSNAFPANVSACRLLDVFFRFTRNEIPKKFLCEQFLRNHFARFFRRSKQTTNRCWIRYEMMSSNKRYRPSRFGRIHSVAFRRNVGKKLTDRDVYARPLVCTACFIGLRTEQGFVSGLTVRWARWTATLNFPA